MSNIILLEIKVNNQVAGQSIKASKDIKHICIIYYGILNVLIFNYMLSFWSYLFLKNDVLY
jgi:hypothetical protein